MRISLWDKKKELQLKGAKCRSSGIWGCVAPKIN